MKTDNWVEENFDLPEEFGARFNIAVEHPTHIRPIVGIVAEISKEHPVLAGLDHREQEYASEYPNKNQDGRHAMRGVNEDIGDTGLEYGTSLFQRPDSGNTVYTDDTKYCEIIGLPLEKTQQKTASELTDWYLEDLGETVRELETDGYIHPQDRDLHAGNNQIIGTATKFHDSSATVRGYWAEEIPRVYELMARDGASWGEIMKHRENMRASEKILGENSFYQERIGTSETQQMTSKEFLQKYLESKHLETGSPPQKGMDRKICFADQQSS